MSTRDDSDEEIEQIDTGSNELIPAKWRHERQQTPDWLITVFEYLTNNPKVLFKLQLVCRDWYIEKLPVAMFRHDVREYEEKRGKIISTMIKANEMLSAEPSVPSVQYYGHDKVPKVHCNGKKIALWKKAKKLEHD